MNEVADIRSKADLADMLERFWGLAPANGFATGWEWEAFGTAPFRQPELESWRQRVLSEVYDLVPSDDPVISRLADDRMAQIIRDLRQDENAQD